ncbi:substrate-binding domain-containing protein [Terrisporobacter mayombei]|uniref:Periplasmic binding protein domain-containing protein n=2 Tax=Terrisporobacter mayombei TaxID=1541 RepID=A0ABY9PXW9_9FIRM|nr:substrate-binding domain-containing protein [Terrisporobacter mayombei]MCC3868381.1 substrate-binding domain-containing protein [Terrisporobacter mayombei]WMT80526.1 hypothetical protein TEMA_08450 [Terrisporobacter mayombei]
MSIPIVTFNSDIKDSKRLAYVGSNYYNSGKTAAGLLNIITYGDVNLGIISGSKNVMCHSERIAGFKDCIENNVTSISFDNIPTTNAMIDKGLIKVNICQQPKFQGSKPLDI